jgi:hypothetical protein
MSSDFFSPRCPLENKSFVLMIFFVSHIYLFKLHASVFHFSWHCDLDRITNRVTMFFSSFAHPSFAVVIKVRQLFVSVCKKNQFVYKQLIPNNHLNYICLLSKCGMPPTLVKLQMSCLYYWNLENLKFPYRQSIFVPWW